MQFLDDDFLLNTKTARQLYHEYASALPIIDYHCHLSPALIASDHRFANLTEAWLAGDHYKWRAMRANGVSEDFCTGDRPDAEKFARWAETVPYTLRNPLYHWTHLELQRYFGVREVLNPSSAARIYEACTGLLQTPEFSVRSLLTRMKVEVVCTTDDPADTLSDHKALAASGFTTRVLPAFRPDNALLVDNPPAFNQYLSRLEKAANISITTYGDLLDALKHRHDFFAVNGCTVSDHGLEEMYADHFDPSTVIRVFDQVRLGQLPSLEERRQFKSALLLQLAEWDHEKGWVQQYHLGALRNNNSRKWRELGPDTGWDSIGDFPQGKALARFLDRLDTNDRLAKTILYNLNPADNALMATMIGNFNDGSFPGKIQFGSAWWFLDQKDGMTQQINALSNMGLLSRFVGMLTDSRSFLSFPRHEYFRRILCRLFGEEVENGELPQDLPWIGKVVSDICYHNAKHYFGFL
ncbi:glucuronate isomerase [Dinghuibacter silviterrae]|uniref:Uronate isomerase n=1 Tax=Dinghuibacter silviterrae TaxID=1539049 RepID=A0A4R8DMI2_9BACT|nr:glucuronate isomerase [Dinghuibacter silviterrae]TDW99199.1 glucuronate isomerase [Dinghuibacter silviterrae]